MPSSSGTHACMHAEQVAMRGISWQCWLPWQGTLQGQQHATAVPWPALCRMMSPRWGHCQLK